MGRKKIKIEPIEGDRNRSATYLKRKYGLFKKAYELSVLTDSDIAVIVFGRNGKLAEFCSGDMDDFLMRYTEYSGAVERRRPEHFAGEAPNGASDPHDEPHVPSCNSIAHEHTHPHLHADLRARLERRRRSSDTATDNENAPPYTLASHAARAAQASEAYAQAPLGKRKDMSVEMPPSVPSNFVGAKDVAMRMANSWDGGRARAVNVANAEAPLHPDAAYARRWSSGRDDFAPAPYVQQPSARRLSGTPMTAPEVAVQDAPERMLQPPALPQHAPSPQAPHSRHSAGPPVHGVDTPPPTHFSALAMPPNPSFALPMNVNFLDPDPSPTRPETPNTNATTPKPSNLLVLPSNVSSPHERIDTGGVLASPLTPIHSSFPASIAQPIDASYHQAHRTMKVSPVMGAQAAHGLSSPLPPEMKRYLPGPGTDMYFAPFEKAPAPVAPRAAHEPSMPVPTGPNTGFVLPPDAPLSPTDGPNAPAASSLFVPPS
ncbi:hypothetical protein CBS9595_000112 [Malassezia furfur]|nr:hypothetical protein CBS9595_000112 [Malassezia furfur]